ncbi:hypothetical protein FZ934_11935 [Rhizobium grahamii]|uniref:Uncharacterized protein n=1 Tax=Rhizobium grahamii TaxID=1120045 RepID=A0A5Q0CAL3_9HYPH|nr:MULTISPECIES: hypothetical protein [Rhizobium]QFY61060.1 hypothetical protein FZ934_11935 [Rhizobium grahamii]QRM49788.1 hypothetical protein F3Y33_10955 [Rhizobium sp. BG6]
MRLLLVIGLSLASAGYSFWTLEMTRSTTIGLEPTGYDLTYTMTWGFGMDQEFSFARTGSSVSGPSSGSIDIWKKPYNSGLALYRSVDGATYYLGLGYKLFTFRPSSGYLKSSCNPDDIPTHTELGMQLSKRIGHERIEALDPGAQHLFNYIEADQQGTLPSLPLSSRYYENLVYLGKFGLIRSEERGSDVGFTPADKSSEPRLGLEFSCG